MFIPGQSSPTADCDAEGVGDVLCLSRRGLSSCRGRGSLKPSTPQALSGLTLVPTGEFEMLQTQWEARSGRNLGRKVTATRVGGTRLGSRGSRCRPGFYSGVTRNHLQYLNRGTTRSHFYFKRMMVV